MKIDVIIKFGGSAVTVKDQLETLKEEELLHACALVNICLDHGKTVVVVHGSCHNVSGDSHWLYR
jgi:isopentenyl phosphate kinase